MFACGNLPPSLSLWKLSWSKCQLQVFIQHCLAVLLYGGAAPTCSRASWRVGGGLPPYNSTWEVLYNSSEKHHYTREYSVICNCFTKKFVQKHQHWCILSNVNVWIFKPENWASEDVFVIIPQVYSEYWNCVCMHMSFTTCVLCIIQSKCTMPVGVQCKVCICCNNYEEIYQICDSFTEIQFLSCWCVAIVPQAVKSFNICVAVCPMQNVYLLPKIAVMVNESLARRCPCPPLHYSKFKNPIVGYVYWCRVLMCWNRR